MKRNRNNSEDYEDYENEFPDLDEERELEIMFDEDQLEELYND